MDQDDGLTISLGAIERRQLVKVVAILVPLLVVAGVGAVLLAPWFVTGTVVLGLIAIGVLASLIVVLRLVPRVLTRQGIELGASGLILYAEPRWWFRGWRAVLPLTTITAATPTRPAGPSLSGGTGSGAPDSPGKGDVGALALTLDRGVPTGGSPVWCTGVAPGAKPLNGEPVSDDHRLVLQLPRADVERLLRAIDQGRATVPRPPATNDAPDGEAWVPLRIGQVVLWTMAGVVALAVTQIPLWSYVSAGVTDRPDPVLIMMITLAVVAAAVIIRFAPSALARQGVAVGPEGLEVRRERLAWQPGCHWRLGWPDLRALSGVFPDHGPLSDLGDRSTATARPGTVLELILNGMPHRPPLPRWARLVPPGMEARRLVADRPRLLIMAGESRTAEQLRFLLARRLRPVEEAGADPVRMVRWVRVPRRGIVRMIITTGALVVVGAGWLSWGLRPFANQPAWQQVVWPAVPLLATAGVVWLLGWLVPARLARGGVQVEPAGLQVVRERFLWSAERRSRLPWEGIGEIRVVQVFSPAALPHGRPLEQAVELELIMPMDQRLPHWAVRAGDGHRIRVLTGDVGAADLIRAIGELRPAS